MYLKNTNDTDAGKERTNCLRRLPFFRTILAFWTCSRKDGFILLTKALYRVGLNEIIFSER